ncbi:serine hydrolase domain-containing protein [Candidatus Latescibacterota bacterium]
MKRFPRILLLVIMVTLAVGSCATDQTFTTDTPESVGLSTERLDRIGNVVQEYIDSDTIAGAVTLVARHGKIAHFEAFGMSDKEAARPMTTDAIFRICSMSKPITSLAVMMLYEEGKFLLSDPVSNYIPEFRNMTVLSSEVQDDGSVGTVRARRQITIRHLLTHTSGLTYQWNRQLGRMYYEAGVNHGMLQDNGTIGESVKKLAGLPLLFEPGEAYEYSLGLDVLGYLVEVVSGMTLDEFFKERIFEPLGLNDTHFFLPEEKVSRLAALYRYSSSEGLTRFPETPVVEDAMIYSADYPYNGPQSYFSGGAGLCSTALDYARFCQMMLNGGELDGVRLISRKTVELMISDHVGDSDENTAFGYGFSIDGIKSQLHEIGSVGKYGWGGYYFTRFFIDPEEDLIGVFMAQLKPRGTVDLREKVYNVIYQSIID